jgi:hypothetical protein
VGNCGRDASGLVQGPVAVSCEHGNKPGFKHGGGFIAAIRVKVFVAVMPYFVAVGYEHIGGPCRLQVQLSWQHD